jgi:hypothetical protein
MGSTMRGLMQKVNMEPFVGALGTELTKNITTLFTAGVKALLPSTKELIVTRVVDSIMEMKNDFGTDSYHYLDPKLQRKGNQGTPRKNSPFKEAIVFVIGGGNYVEYLNLQEYAKVRHRSPSSPTSSFLSLSSETSLCSFYGLISFFFLPNRTETTRKENHLRLHGNPHCPTIYRAIDGAWRQILKPKKKQRNCTKGKKKNKKIEKNQTANLCEKFFFWGKNNKTTIN